MYVVPGSSVASQPLRFRKLWRESGRKTQGMTAKPTIREAQKALTALQAQFTPRQSQLQALNDEVETLRKQMESTNDKVSESERATRVQTLDKKEHKNPRT